MDLRFSSESIRKIEGERRSSLVEIISDYSVTTVHAFVREGLKLTDKRADEELDRFAREGGSLMRLYLTIIDKLQDQGFLDRSLKIGMSLREELTRLDLIEEEKTPDSQVSQSTGSPESPSQSE